MKSHLKLALILSVLFTAPAIAQTTAYFEIKVPTTKIKNSRFNQIIFIDSRSDTTSLGTIQKGFLNKKAILLPKRPFKEQLNDVFAGLIDTSAEPGTLIFQLRQLNFAERTNVNVEDGYCTLRAKLYKLDGQRYQELNTIDTVMSVRGAEITKRLYGEGSWEISDFISRNLHSTVSDARSYAYHEVLKIDSIERSSLKLFNTTSFENGFYLCYTSFKNQTPEFKNVSGETKGDMIKIYTTDSTTGKRITRRKAYAVVQEGKPYILTERGFYPLQKVGNDLCFTAPIAEGIHPGSYVATAALAGLTGAFIFPMIGNSKYYVMKIDPFTGAHIPVRQLSKEEFKSKKSTAQIN